MINNTITKANKNNNKEALQAFCNTRFHFYKYKIKMVTKLMTLPHELIKKSM